MPALLMIMNNYVDLHIHSTFSDGTLTPTEIVQEASRVGLRAIALADHDNIDGIPEATHAGQKIGLEVLTGVELSVVWRNFQDIHLLGYVRHHGALVGRKGPERGIG